MIFLFGKACEFKLSIQGRSCFFFDAYIGNAIHSTSAEEADMIMTVLAHPSSIFCIHYMVLTVFV
jgi:hypothetical protein